MYSQQPLLSEWGIPVWCHHHCFKMEIESYDQAKRIIKIAGSAAWLEITPLTQHDNITWWEIKWRVQHARDVQATGKNAITSEILSAMFGITNDFESNGSQWLLDRFGGTTAHQGSFIRWSKFLNVPCPGTGHDGDPNISLMITEDMQKAVLDLFNNK